MMVVVLMIMMTTMMMMMIIDASLGVLPSAVPAAAPAPPRGRHA
jgi:hypothetical protein